MVVTRGSTNTESSRQQDGKDTTGTKRKEHVTSPQPEHQPKAQKHQTTIEESIGSGAKQDGYSHQDAEMGEASSNQIIEDQSAKQSNEAKENTEHAGDGEKHGPKGEEPSDEKKPDANGDAIEESSSRKTKLPSSILEKGIIYFFTRNRVGLESAESVGDLQRTYFVLRPLPDGAKLTDGAIPDLKNNRLLALPKKTFPKGHSDRFMAFVEKAPTSIQDLKENFFKGAEYETQTSGTRQQQPIQTIGEGVYAITRTENRTTHLAYAVTIPIELGEVQTDLGLRSQGSFIISVKNPERPGPASARLPEGPKFPKEIIEEFRGLAWAEVKPKYLDYANCQILLIGENADKALDHTTKDQKHNKDDPKEELERLEHEDELRVEHMHGNDTVFDDLNISKKDYPKVPTTW